MEIEEKMMEERIVQNPMNLVRAAYFAGVHDGIGKGCEISGIGAPGDEIFEGFMESVEKNELGNEVVRCMDCRFSIDHGFGCTFRGTSDPAVVKPIGFCSWGERKEDAD